MVDPHLLPYLVVRSAGNERPKWLPAALAGGLLASILALAGPAWDKIELPAFKTQQPTVLVLSLAQSMNATDLSPNRLTRAVHKLRDIMGRLQGGDMALIIYADRPFVAAPLTSDTRVIEQMLPELSTSLMPVVGNRLNLAIDNARELLTRVNAHSGRIVVIADDAGVEADKAISAAASARDDGFEVSVLGVGTTGGAELQTARGQAITDRNGKVMTTQLAATDLGQLAEEGGGHFATLTADDQDLATLLGSRSGKGAVERPAGENFHSDSWNDMGYWLLVIPVLLVPLAFRKNVLMAFLPFVVATGLGLPADDAHADTLDNLWRTPDQQGARAFADGDYEVASENFENLDWKASAQYRAGQYGDAAQTLGMASTPDGFYNLGNALAYAGQLEQALQAYDKSLERAPGDTDARFNRDLVASLLEQQKQDQQDGGQQQSSSGSQDQIPQDAENSGGDSGGNKGSNPDQDSNSANAQNSGQEGTDAPAAQGNQEQQARADGSGQNPSQPGASSQQDSADSSNHDMAAGGAQEDQADAQPGEPQDQPQSDGEKNLAQAGADAQHADGRNAFQQAMDKLLQGNGSGQVTPQETTVRESADDDQAFAGLSELDQAREQKLRAVPDDASGLLRARIRQHYSQLYPDSR